MALSWVEWAAACSGLSLPLGHSTFRAAILGNALLKLLNNQNNMGFIDAELSLLRARHYDPVSLMGP